MKKENLTGNAVNGKSILGGMSNGKLFIGSLFEKVKNLFKKEDAGKVLQTSKTNIIYGGLPTKEYITKVEAWKDLSECGLNLNKEVNEIRNLFLDGKNEKWLDQLGLWEDKVLCMDSITLLEIDKVLELSLRDFELKEMAEHLDVPINTVKSRLWRARKSLTDLVSV